MSNSTGPAVTQFKSLAIQRRNATIAQTASTKPNGQAPCKKPYSEPSKQAIAKARTNQWLRFSSA